MEWASISVNLGLSNPNESFLFVLPPIALLKATPLNSETHMKVIYWLEIIYVLAYEAIYLTILALYIKLFPHTWLRNPAYALGILVTLDNIGNIFVLVFQCTPIRFYWDKTVKGGHCINDRLAYFISSLILIIAIIVALLLPLPLLWKLKISSGKRWQLLAAFSVGLFVAITSIYRLAAILRISNEDPTFTFLETGTWSALEIGAGVVATCLSSMTPLIYWVVAAFKSSSSSNSPTTLHGRYDNYGNPISHGPLRSSQFNRIPPGNDTKQPSSGNDTMVEMSGNISRDRIDGEEEDDRKRLVEDHLDKRTTPGDKVRVTTSVKVSIRPLGKDQVAAPVAPAVLGG